jgi:cobalt-zinc-cadmium efflux system membrane fusion protein
VRLVLAVGFVAGLLGCAGGEAGGGAHDRTAQTEPATGQVGDPDDWCAGHGVPESACPLCDPTVEARYREAGDWCEGHGFPESVCPSCNPVAPPGDRVTAGQVADAGDWCAEHGVPESACPLCDVGVEGRYREAGDWCEEHGFPESVCPRCNPMVPPGGGTLPGGLVGSSIRFRSAEIEQTAGIEVAPADGIPMAGSVQCTATIDFNRNRLADVRTTVPGLVRVVAVDLGQQVQRGSVLFELESAQVGDLTARRRAARERMETAGANLSRLENLRSRQIPSARQLELAEQELRAAEAELHSIEQFLQLTGGSDSGVSGRFEIRSPMDGTVVRRPAVVGSFATEADSLATVADTSRMWAMLDVNEFDVAGLSVGQRVDVQVDGVPHRLFEGQVSWIASEVDARTRKVSVRAEVHNHQGLLRAGQFARARVLMESPDLGVSIPTDAVQRLEDRSVVFLRTGPLSYEPRAVQVGRSDGRRVQIVDGLAAGEPVVTIGAYLLKTELMRGSLGSGCCEVEPRRVD